LAGIWTTWTSVRKLKAGEVTADLFGFLTTEPNAKVGAIYPQVKPAILTDSHDEDTWLEAPGTRRASCNGLYRTVRYQWWRGVANGQYGSLPFLLNRCRVAGEPRRNKALTIRSGGCKLLGRRARTFQLVRGSLVLNSP
jgi:hypothetical protein